MTKEHKVTITKSRNFLTEHIDTDGLLLDALQEKFVLVSYDADLIRAEVSSIRMNSVLLDRLLKKPDKAYEDFILSLSETNQQHISDYLRQMHAEG